MGNIFIINDSFLKSAKHSVAKVLVEMDVCCSIYETLKLLISEHVYSHVLVTNISPSIEPIVMCMDIFW